MDENVKSFECIAMPRFEHVRRSFLMRIRESRVASGHSEMQNLHYSSEQNENQLEIPPSANIKSSNCHIENQQLKGLRLKRFRSAKDRLAKCMENTHQVTQQLESIPASQILAKLRRIKNEVLKGKVLSKKTSKSFDDSEDVLISALLSGHMLDLLRAERMQIDAIECEYRRQLLQCFRSSLEYSSADSDFRSNFQVGTLSPLQERKAQEIVNEETIDLSSSCYDSNQSFIETSQGELFALMKMDSILEEAINNMNKSNSDQNGEEDFQSQTVYSDNRGALTSERVESLEIHTVINTIIALQLLKSTTNFKELAHLYYDKYKSALSKLCKLDERYENSLQLIRNYRQEIDGLNNKLETYEYLIRNYEDNSHTISALNQKVSHLEIELNEYKEKLSSYQQEIERISKGGGDYNNSRRIINLNTDYQINSYRNSNDYYNNDSIQNEYGGSSMDSSLYRNAYNHSTANFDANNITNSLVDQCDDVCGTSMKDYAEFNSNQLNAIIDKFESFIFKLKQTKVSVEENERKEKELKLLQKLKKETNGNKYEMNSELSNENMTCCICRDAMKTILLLPCKHFCLCENCSNIGRLDICPICREFIREKIKVYS